MKIAVVRISDVSLVVEMYYSKTELCNSDIREIFNCGSTAASKLKKQALEHQVSKNVKTFSARCVDTECAFQAWGIDIDKLEKKAKKLAQFNRNKLA